MYMVFCSLKVNFESILPYFDKLLRRKVAPECIELLMFSLKVLLIKANWCSIMVKMTPMTFEEYQNESYILVIEDFDIALTPISFLASIIAT